MIWPISKRGVPHGKKARSVGRVGGYGSRGCQKDEGRPRVETGHVSGFVWSNGHDAPSCGRIDRAFSSLGGSFPIRIQGVVLWSARQREKMGRSATAYLTFEEEKEFLSGFFENASRGGILVVSAIRTALEKKLGTRWSKLPYTGC